MRPAKPNGKARIAFVAARMTFSSEWKIGPMTKSPRTDITRKVKNGTTSKSSTSGIFLCNHFSSFAPSSPMKKAGNTEF